MNLKLSKFSAPAKKGKRSAHGKDSTLIREERKHLLSSKSDFFIREA